jgi:hypothetical protein
MAKLMLMKTSIRSEPSTVTEEGMRQPVGQHWENWLTKLRKALGQLFPPKLFYDASLTPNDSTVIASKRESKTQLSSHDFESGV